MIKASTMSLSCGLFTADGPKHTDSKFQSTKDPLAFMSGDPTVYGNAELKMPQAGYDIVKKCILNPKNHSYTPSNGTVAAREAVAKHYSAGTELKIGAPDVIITHGANMGLFIALMSITNPGDNVLVPEPGYPFFHKTGPSVGVEARGYRLNPSKNFEIDLEYLSTLVDSRTRFLWVVNPSNPTGAVFSEAHMEEIFAFCRAHNLFIISDEVYWNESFEGVKFTSFGHAAKDVPVIVIGGFEKTFLVPGWGLSWMIFADPKKQLNEIRSGCLTTCQIYLHPCSFLMAALPELLDTLTLDYTKNYMGIFEENHEYLAEEMKEIEGLKPVLAQGTFYLSVLIELEKFSTFQSDSDFLQALYDEENVKIMPLSSFKGDIQGFRMLTCANKPLYVKLIPRLQAFTQRHLKNKSSE